MHAHASSVSTVQAAAMVAMCVCSDYLIDFGGLDLAPREAPMTRLPAAEFEAKLVSRRSDFDWLSAPSAQSRQMLWMNEHFAGAAATDDGTLSARQDTPTARHAF
jgi:hypothetical protein